MNVKRLDITVMTAQRNNSNKVKRDFLRLSIQARKIADKILCKVIEPLQERKNGKGDKL